MVQRSCAKIPASALIALRRSVGILSVTETGLPLLNVIPLFKPAPMPTSPVNCWIKRQRPSVIVPPTLNECDPVTYDAENDSVNSFEKWSPGFGQPFEYFPVD